MSLSSKAVAHPITTIMVTLCVIVLGVISFMRLRIDLLPDISFPDITVFTEYEGVAPEDIENLITRPIEEAVSTVPGVTKIESVSMEGRSSIELEFTWGTSLDSALDDVRSRVERLRGMLPEDVESPVVFRFDLTAFPIMFMGVSGTIEPYLMRQIVDKTVKYRLERLDGVAAMNVRGGYKREIQVNLDSERLAASKVSPSLAMAALKRSNMNVAGGLVEESRSNVLVRTMGEFMSLDAIRKVIVTTRIDPGQNGAAVPVSIDDLGSVDDGSEDITNIARINGEPGIRIGINKQSDANTVQVADRVLAEIEKLNEEFHGDLTIRTIVNTADFIRDSISSVWQAVLWGAGLSVLVLLLFLYNWRSTAVIGIAIPISVLATFGGMYIAGMSLNMISFGGLALGIGMLVDNSIVVHENIFRQLEFGLPRLDAAIKGTEEVSDAVTASTLTTVAVFAPVLFLGGFAAIFFKELAFVVTMSLVISLVSSLTLVPVLSRMAMGKKWGSGTGRLVFMERAIRRMEDAYGRSIRRVIGHPVIVLLVSVAMLAGAIALVPRLGFELMPQADEGEISVDLELPVGTRIEETDKVVRKAEDLIMSGVPELERINSLSGTSGSWHQAGEESGSLRVVLREPRQPGDRTTDEVAAALRKMIVPFVAGGRVRIQPSEGFFLLRMLRGGGERLEVKVRGYDLGDAAALAKRVEKAMQAVKGVSDVRISRREGMGELRLFPDPEAVSRAGLDVASLGELVGLMVSGAPAGYYRDAGEEYTIRVRLSEEDRRDPTTLADAPVFVGGGSWVPLRSLVRMDRDTGPVSIERENQERSLVVSAGLDGTRDLGSISRDLKKAIDGIEKPVNFQVMIAGEYEEQKETLGVLMGGLILAIMLVYMVMASLYESLLHPLLILLSVPFALIGVILTLFATGTTVNIESAMGTVVLVGVVVNNAILLVDYTNLLRTRDGMPVTDALVLAGSRRLRPILMTTLTTSVALLPVAFAIGRGTETQAPMARAIVGGLVFGTLVTLVYLPTLYNTVETWRERRAARRA